MTERLISASLDTVAVGAETFCRNAPSPYPGWEICPRSRGWLRDAAPTGFRPARRDNGPAPINGPFDLDGIAGCHPWIRTETAHGWTAIPLGTPPRRWPAGCRSKHDSVRRHLSVGRLYPGFRHQRPDVIDDRHEPRTGDGYRPRVLAHRGLENLHARGTGNGLAFARGNVYNYRQRELRDRV